MATNKKFRIQNGANIEGELSFSNVTVVDSDGLVVAASVQPAVESIVDTTFVNALNVSAFDAITAQSVTDISSFTTTDVSEGANLYFTAQRARDAVQAGTGVSYDAATGAISASLTGGDGISVSGDQVSLDGSAISQDLVPGETDLYSLGTPDKVWKDLFIGPGSLYLNGTKILEDNSGTITMYADPGQNLSFGVTAGGAIDLNAGDESIQMRSDVVMSAEQTISTVGGVATKFGGAVDMQGSQVNNVGAPTVDADAANKAYVDGRVDAGSIAGDKTFSDNVVVEGDLTVQGTTTTVNSETISLADNIIDVNSNVTSGIPTEHAGLRVMRGDEAAAQLRWNEASDHWETFNGSAWTKVALTTGDLEEGSNLYHTEARVDANVDPKIASESSARQSADSVLQSNIDSEEAARQSADAGLQSSVDGLTSGLADEVSDRTAGDAATLASAKAYADAIEAASQAQDAAHDVAIQTNANAISQEVADRTAGDSQLQSAIDVLTSGLADEVSDRTSGDASLQSAVNAVDARVDGILSGSTVDLDSLKEIVDAFEGADSDLQNVMTSNSSRLTTAEADIDTLESAMSTRVTEIGGINTTISDIDARLVQEIADRTSAIAPIAGNISTGDAATLASANSYTDAAVSPITGTTIPALQSKDTEQDGRLDTLETEMDAVEGRATSLESDVATKASTSSVNALTGRVTIVEGRLDTDRGEWEAADSTETAARIAADNALGVRIDNLISNTDATALNSLSELVTEFQSVDNSLTAMITANNSAVNVLDSRVTSNDLDIANLNASMTQAQSDIISLPGQIKGDLSGGLCITYTAGTGVIEIDEAEVRAQLVTHDADNLGGEDPSHYRINVYRVDGALVN